jgi:hypothetical protein
MMWGIMMWEACASRWHRSGECEGGGALCVGCSWRVWCGGGRGGWALMMAEAHVGVVRACGGSP